jgi:cell division protein FtsX
VAEAFASISAAVKAVRPDIDFRYNNDTHREDLAGLRYDLIRDSIDTIRVSDYIEQRGDVPDGAYLTKKRNLFKAREGIGFDKKLLATVAIRPNATPEVIRKSLMHLSETGIDGISMAHYDGSRTAHLDAVKQGMQEAGIVIRGE